MFVLNPIELRNVLNGMTHTGCNMSKETNFGAAEVIVKKVNQGDHAKVK